jgi:hypothetical protein
MILVALSLRAFDDHAPGLRGFDDIIGFFLARFGSAVHLVAVEEISRRYADDEYQQVYQYG